MRWKWYVEDGHSGPLRKLPARVRTRLGLDDEGAAGSRLIEIGGGPYPIEGRLHVDSDPRAAHVESRASAWALPFDDAYATEIVAIHVLEHVPPPMLVPTLREWHRVLAPGGVAHVHVPNAPQLMDAFQRARLPEKWALMGAINGMYADPARTRSPDELTASADHQVMFDWEVLSWALSQAGFSRVEDRTLETADRHTVGWRAFVSNCSLVAVAIKD